MTLNQVTEALVDVQSDKKDLLVALVHRAIMVKEQIDSMRPLYQELDDLTLQARTLFEEIGQTSFDLGTIKITLVNNFAEKNTVFRPAGVRMYELKVEQPKEKKEKKSK